MNAPGVQHAGLATTAEAWNVSRSVSFFFLFLFFALSSAWGVDSSRHISQYGHTAWRIQDGVFSGAPNAIAQTTDGYLWIGTQNGLIRFDGVRFVPWVPLKGKTPVERDLFAPGRNGWQLMDWNINEPRPSSERHFDQLSGYRRTRQFYRPGARRKNLDHALTSS